MKWEKIRNDKLGVDLSTQNILSQINKGNSNACLHAYTSMSWFKINQIIIIEMFLRFPKQQSDI